MKGSPQAVMFDPCFEFIVKWRQRNDQFKFMSSSSLYSLRELQKKALVEYN
jgi:hypothetical protein